MNGEKSIETLLYKYIGDHGLHDSDALPYPDELASSLGCDIGALDSAIEAACTRGVLARSETSGLVVQSLLAMPDQEWLSFTHSAKVHGEEMRTTVHEARLRLPVEDSEDPVTTEFEREAYKALGLEKGNPFIVITRIRRLHSPRGDDQRVIHRAYLDPKRFPETFLSDHDFARESLVHIYNSYGYRVQKRADAMKARLACPAERNDLKIGYEPVLELQQRTIASGPDSDDRFLLEYLWGTYWNLTFEFER